MGIGVQLGIGIDPIIVGATAGATAVGLYAAGSGLVRYVGLLLLPVVGVLLPSFSEIAFSRPESIQPVVLRCLRLAAGLGTIVFGAMLVSATPMLEDVDRSRGRAQRADPSALRHRVSPAGLPPRC